MDCACAHSNVQNSEPVRKYKREKERERKQIGPVLPQTILLFFAVFAVAFVKLIESNQFKIFFFFLFSVRKNDVLVVHISRLDIEMDNSSNLQDLTEHRPS